MSYLTVSSKRPYGDEWVQVKCDGEGCGALGPRVEIARADNGAGDLPRQAWIYRWIARSRT